MSAAHTSDHIPLAFHMKVHNGRRWRRKGWWWKCERWQDEYPDTLQGQAGSDLGRVAEESACGDRKQLPLRPVQPSLYPGNSNTTLEL